MEYARCAVERYGSRPHEYYLKPADIVTAVPIIGREYDEPFLLLDEARLTPLRAAAEARGLQLTRGGRFLHLCGDTDKGRALRALVALLAEEGRAFATVGLGDAPNDLPLKRHDYRVHFQLVAGLL